MRKLPALLFTLLLIQASTIQAEDFFLKDARTVTAAYVGEANGVITILDADGERTLLRADVDFIRWTPVSDAELRRRASHRRQKFYRARLAAAKKLVKTYGRAKVDARPSIAAELEGFTERERIPVFSRAVLSQKSEVREFVLGQLEKMGRVEAVAPLVLAAVGVRDKKFTDRAHASAVKKNAEFARLLYEYAAAIPMEADARINALDRLGLMGQKDSVLPLILTLHSLGLEAGLQKSEVQSIRRKPVNLGNTRINVELPVVTYFETATSLRYTVPTIARMQNAAVRALEQITGEKLGKDIRAWQEWLEETTTEEPH